MYSERVFRSALDLIQFHKLHVNNSITGSNSYECRRRLSRFSCRGKQHGRRAQTSPCGVITKKDVSTSLRNFVCVFFFIYKSSICGILCSGTNLRLSILWREYLFWWKFTGICPSFALCRQKCWAVFSSLSKCYSFKHKTSETVWYAVTSWKK